MHLNFLGLYRTRISSFTAFNLFVWLNLLIFFDRGIIPGAIEEFSSFVMETTPYVEVDMFVGLLQSSFVIGLVVGSIVFNSSSGRLGKFQLASIALILWLLSVALSGLAFYAKSYYMLLFARMVSGFGEACILFDIPNWILYAAPEVHRGTWLGIFYTSIPVGTAVGYAFSAGISSTSWGWPFAFYVEAFLTLPLLIFVTTIVDDDQITFNSDHKLTKRLQLRRDSSAPAKMSLYLGMKNALNSPIFLFLTLGSAAQAAVMASFSTFGSSYLIGLGYFDSEEDASSTLGVMLGFAALVATPFGGFLVDWLDPQVSISGQQKVYHRRQPYLGEEHDHECSSDEEDDAYARTRGLSIRTDDGINSTRSPSNPPVLSPEPQLPRHQKQPLFRHENGRSHSEVSASGTSITATVSKASDLTVPVSAPVSAPVSEDELKYRQYCAVERCCALLYWTALLASLCFTLTIFAQNQTLFLFFITLAFALCYLSSAAIVMGQSVEMSRSYQSVSSEIGLLLLHMLGDVPGPIIGGYIKGYLAPNCMESSRSVDCRSDPSGLRWSIFWVGLWSFGGLVCFAVAWHRCSQRVHSSPRRAVEMTQLLS